MKKGQVERGRKERECRAIFLLCAPPSVKCCTINVSFVKYWISHPSRSLTRSLIKN